MKTILIPAFLLAVASSYAALSPATGARLTDYTHWFAPEFKVASDADWAVTPCPVWRKPAPFSDTNRVWSGWVPNWGPTALNGPIVGVSNNAGFTTQVEFAFLGETAGWWDNIGYRLNGVDHLLADGIQTVGTIKTRRFGDYWETTLNAGDRLDFFVVGTEKKTSPNGIINPVPQLGGKFFVFDQTSNIPASATMQSYYGTIAPLTNVREVNPRTGLYDESWTVMGFEDIQTSKRSGPDYNDIVFAFRAGGHALVALDPVPEPSAYGLMGAAALLALAGYRRFRRV